MSKPTPALDKVQRWMQAAVMHPDGVAEGMKSPQAREAIDAGSADDVVTRSKTLTAEQRLSIYGNAYYARLLECLREEYPATAHALGEETFDSFAAAYLQNYPSHSYTLCRLGAEFSRFLKETRPPREEGEPAISWPEFLADLAAFEWAFSEVFDGPGVEGKEILDEAKIRAVSPEHWPESRMVPVPCLRLLAFRFPVQTYHAEVRDEKTPSLPAPAETLLALTRRSYVVCHSVLSAPEYRLLNALIAGRTVGEAVAEIAPASETQVEGLAANLHTWFRSWAALGFFQAVELPG